MLLIADHRCPEATRVPALTARQPSWPNCPRCPGGRPFGFLGSSLLQVRDDARRLSLLGRRAQAELLERLRQEAGPAVELLEPRPEKRLCLRLARVVAQRDDRER